MYATTKKLWFNITVVLVFDKKIRKYIGYMGAKNIEGNIQSNKERLDEQNNDAPETDGNV